jgi:hypothetical protein
VGLEEQHNSIMRANLKKAAKQREELSPERLRELTTTTRTRPFDERRRPPPPRKQFAEVDNTDPDFDFERVPLKGQRPSLGSDYEDFGVSAPLIESPLVVVKDEADEFSDEEVDSEVHKDDGRITPTTTLRSDSAHFADIRDKFETARQEITTEFSHFSQNPPVEGNYMVMRMGAKDLSSTPLVNVSLAGGHDLGPPSPYPDRGDPNLTDNYHSGRDGRFQRPPVAEGSLAAHHYREVFNFSLPDGPAFPNSLHDVVHHNPFRHNFEQLNKSREAGDFGAYGLRNGATVPDLGVGADLPAEDPWRLDLDVDLDPPKPAVVVPDRYEEYYKRRHPAVVRTSQLTGPAPLPYSPSPAGYGHHLYPGTGLVLYSNF